MVFTWRPFIHLFIFSHQLNPAAAEAAAWIVNESEWSVLSCCLPTNLTLPSERQGRNHDPLELVMFLQFSLELPQIGSFSSAATLLRGLMHLALAQITFCIPHFNERFLAVYSPQQHGSYALRTPAPNWKASSARPDGGPTTPPPPIPLPVALQFLFFLFFFFLRFEIMIERSA